MQKGKLLTIASTVHCSMLAEDAIKAAIADYQDKNPQAAMSDLSGRARKLEKEANAAAS